MSTLFILIFIICWVTSFLMSGMEAGVFALSRLRIRQHARAGHQRAHLLSGYLQNPEPFLWTILVGNTLATLTAASIGFFGAYELLGSWPVWFWVTFILGVVVFYVTCEWLPKMVFRLYPNRLCMALVPIFGMMAWVLRPGVWVLAQFASFLLRWTGGTRFTGHLFGNRDELRVLMNESSQSLSHIERSMIDRVMDLQNLTARHSAVPWAKVICVTTQTSVREMVELCREHSISRVPVLETGKGVRRVAGLADLKSVLFRTDYDPAKPVAQFMKPALFLEEDLRLEVALRQMQRSGQRLAIVLGRDQQELGILSLENILSVIFGEVRL